MDHDRHWTRLFLVAAVGALLLTHPFPSPAAPSSALSADILKKIDLAAAEALAKSGSPGASIAIVRDGRVAYLQAYGDSRLDPKQPSEPAVRYAIGSITKQFTAAAVLLLQQDGKLSLDDPVAKYLPDLTRASETTIRQLLSHTAGYQDYWPQDYMFPLMAEPISPQGITDRWARISLDYDPGTKWQYSNTGYVIAGRIIEKVSGQPLFEFMRERIFEPLQMASVRNFDKEPLIAGNATGYLNYALGPPRVVVPSGPGWLFAAGDLAMTAEDLAKWDISVIDGSLLSPASYGALESAALLSSGASAQYGLGVDVALENDRRKISHDGAVNGFTASNVIYPDDRVAVVVLVNHESSVPGQLASKLAEILFDQAQPDDDAKTTRARAILDGLQQGRFDRGLFTENANFYFSEQALADFKSSLGPLGAPTSFTQTGRWLRGGMTGRSYEAKFANTSLEVWTYEMPDGLLEQFLVGPAED